MLKRISSENNELSLGQTLTKLNLTHYRTQSKELRGNRKEIFYRKEFSLKQASPKKSKQKKKSPLNKNLFNVSTFGTLDMQKIRKKRKRGSQQPISINVTSMSEKLLIESMNPQNLPRIQIKNRLRDSPVQKMIGAVRNDKKFRKFTETYFKSIEKAKASVKDNEIGEEFPQIKVLGWSVKGFVINDKIVLKATRWQKKSTSTERTKIEKYKKFLYNKQIRTKVNEDWHKFVRDWLYLDQVLLK